MKIAIVCLASLLILSVCVAGLLVKGTNSNALLTEKIQSPAVEAQKPPQLSEKAHQAHAQPSSSLTTKADHFPSSVVSSGFPPTDRSSEPPQVPRPLPSPNSSQSSRPTSSKSQPAATHVSAFSPAGSILPIGVAESVEITVPRGMILPATFSDSSKDRTPEQAAALDQIADEFLDAALPAATVPRVLSDGSASNSNVGDAQTVSPVSSDARSAGPTVTAPDLLNAGGDSAEALRLANERYRQLFGQEAFNAWSSRAAIEALSD